MANQSGQDQYIAKVYQDVEKIIGQYKTSSLPTDFSLIKVLTHCVLLDGRLHLEFNLPFVWNNGFEALKNYATDLLLQIDEVKSIDWKVNYNIATLQRNNQLKGVPGVKNIIAVSSGKGGVGKSSIAVNLALSLSAEGGKVGILDADVYGPSIPLLLGTADKRPESPDGEHMMPVKAYSLLSNSIGYISADDQPVIWRGPMASQAVLQLLNSTLWLDLDYLVIDLPPGTGDIQLTLAQNIPVTSALIVTTPQDIALADVVKGIAMFQQVNIPIVGIVENMSGYTCSHCGQFEPIFGQGGAVKLAEKYHLDVLAHFPLDIKLSEHLEKNCPIVMSEPQGKFAIQYKELADKIATKMYQDNKTIPTEIPLRIM